jgi:hypothetical protein
MNDIASIRKTRPFPVLGECGTTAGPDEREAFSSASGFFSEDVFRGGNTSV